MGNHRLRRTDLFLVRMWVESSEGAEGTGDTSDGSGDAPPRWRGKVQRVVDGESHQFGDLVGLLDCLTRMLADGGMRKSSHRSSPDTQE